MAGTRAALVLVAAAAALVAVSGGSPSDPRTPPALSGMPPPFLTAAVIGSGGTTAGIDAYGAVVDLRAGPAGRALVDNPYERQLAGSVEPGAGIVPRFSLDGGPPQPPWRADSVRQGYLRGTSILRTVTRFGEHRVVVLCAATGATLGCLGGSSGATSARDVLVSFDRHGDRGGGEIHLDDEEARHIVAAERRAGRRWLERARALGPGAPAWAAALYERSLLVLRTLTDSRTGAVAAGARDGWAHVWPRDAGAVAIALAAAGYRPEARRVARFLLRLDLGAAARFDGSGEPVPGRAAQGDAAGWTLAAARAAGLAIPARKRASLAGYEWRGRADYQEKAAGKYLGNALAAAAGGRPFRSPDGLVREGGNPGAGLDSAAAWAVRPFSRPRLFPVARHTMLALAGEGGRYGMAPSQSWPHAESWTAPTAWTAWSLAALGERRAALRLLAALRRAATPAGLLPERVDAASGVPTSTTPLAWSHSFTILAMRELWSG